MHRASTSPGRFPHPRPRGRQAHAARIAEAQHEFDALEAAEAQLALKMSAGPRAVNSSMPRASQARLELPHDGERLRGNRGRADGALSP